MRLVDVVLRFAHLFGVELPIPGLQLERDSRGRLSSTVDELLHSRRFAARLPGRCGNHVGHQLDRVCRRLGHFIVEVE